MKWLVLIFAALMLAGCGSGSKTHCAQINETWRATVVDASNPPTLAVAFRLVDLETTVAGALSPALNAEIPGVESRVTLGIASTRLTGARCSHCLDATLELVGTIEFQGRRYDISRGRVLWPSRLEVITSPELTEVIAIAETPTVELPEVPQDVLTQILPVIGEQLAVSRPVIFQGISTPWADRVRTTAEMFVFGETTAAGSVFDVSSSLTPAIRDRLHTSDPNLRVADVTLEADGRLTVYVQRWRLSGMCGVDETRLSGRIQADVVDLQKPGVEWLSRAHVETIAHGLARELPAARIRRPIKTWTNLGGGVFKVAPVESLKQSKDLELMRLGQTCFDRALTSDRPDIGGRLELEWSIDAQGVVVDARVVSDTTQSPSTAACMLDGIRAMPFPPGAPRTKRRVFLFKQPGR